MTYFPNQVNPGDITESIGELIQCKAANSQRAYYTALDILAEFLEVKRSSYRFERELVAMTPLRAGKFVKWLRNRKGGDGKRVADTTVAQRIAILRRIFRHLIDIGVRVGNPIGVVSDVIPLRQRVQKRPTKLIPFDAVQNILDAPDASTKEGIRDRALLALLFGGGLRRSEAIKLNIGDIGEGNDGVPFLILRATKAGQNQTQSLPTWAWKRVLKYLEQRDDDISAPQSPLFVFYYKNGEPGRRMSDTTLARIYKRYAASVGIVGAAPHSARATAVTRLKEMGYEDRDVANFLRHSTEHMVRVYDKRGRGPARNPGRLLEYPRSDDDDISLVA
jgi:integrase/recombinase XerD